MHALVVFTVGFSCMNLCGNCAGKGESDVDVTWSTASCAWLCYDFLYYFRNCSTERNNQGSSLVHIRKNLIPQSERQSLLILIRWDLGKRKSIVQLMILLGRSISFNFGIKYHDLLDQMLYVSQKGYLSHCYASFRVICVPYTYESNIYRVDESEMQVPNAGLM